MIEHTKGSWKARGRLVHSESDDSLIAAVYPATQQDEAVAKANAHLAAKACEAPHECSDPQCPGNVNRRKLEAYDGLLAAYNAILAGPVDEPQIELTGEYHTGLHCGLEDRDISDRYDACDYGFEKGVERALEWAYGVVETAIAKAKE